jgi:hypothetical protein
MAEQQRNAQGIVASELGIAKVFHDAHEQEHKPQEFSSADSMKDIVGSYCRALASLRPMTFRSKPRSKRMTRLSPA